ncbi:MAG: N-acetyltransferase [Fusobacteriales bacterium]|nr:MAG: N-acetyltransferase [Fusobacteriales bacterium]
MRLNIRKMKLDDWGEVSKIYDEGIKTNIATFQENVPKYEDWDFSHLNEFRYVGIIDEKIVGWVALSPISSRAVYLGVVELSIYISENFRGLGIGKKLVDYIIEKTENNNVWTIQSSIIEENSASIELHKKCGFRMVGYRERIAKDKNGVWKNTILMERRSKL